MTQVLFVHGINNQNNSKERIEREWCRAFQRGAAVAGVEIPSGVQYRAAFYGDLLYEETENWHQHAEAARPMSAESEDDDYVNEDVAALYLEFQRRYGISDADIAAELDAADDLRNRQRMAKGIHKRWLKALARGLQKVLPSNGSRGIAKAFLRQAAAYLHKPGLKERVDDLVLGQVLVGHRAGERLVLVSHSLGTIIAYDLLRRLRHEQEVALLLTAGSPLGIEMVKKRLGPPLVCPQNAGRWVNVSDREDFVALETTLTRASFGCDQIRNLDPVDNGDDDAHDILQYLAHGQVAREIAAHL